MLRPLRRIFFLLASGILCFGLVISAVAAEDQYRTAGSTAQFTGPWDLANLKKVPPATWGAKSGLLQEVFYEGEPLDGKPTRVFAYLGRPESSTGPLPAVVLVHGGGGIAFPKWATLWAQRGYVALAMNLGGYGPDKRLPDGGPSQDDGLKFRNFTEVETDQMWTYHAVAAVIRGHSLLASCKEVDPQRIGITGISWGGYLTCIVTGIDDRLKVSVPVYGCGFLHENSFSGWMAAFAKMSAEQRARWIGMFDPSRYLAGVRCPIFFVNGTNDFAYPLDSYQKSYRLVPGRVDVRVEVDMPHGHVEGWSPAEIGLYVDSVLKGGDPLPKLGPMAVADGRVLAEFVAKQPVVKGQLHYTSDTGPWPERKWVSADAKVVGTSVQAELPGQRPLVYYLSVTDHRGAMVSTQRAVLP